MSYSHIYSPFDVAQLMQATAAKHNTSLTLPQMAMGASIVMAESRGNPLIPGHNGDGSIDRGLWQFNNHSHAVLTDANAYNAANATEYAYTLTNGFQLSAFPTIWHDNKGRLSKGLNPANIAAATAAILAKTPGTDTNPSGSGTIDTSIGIGGLPGGVATGPGISNDPSVIAGIPLVPGAAAAGAGDIAGALTPDWLANLGKLSMNLLNGSWWKRVGIGALGLVVLIVAMYLLFSKDIESTAAPIVKAATL